MTWADAAFVALAIAAIASLAYGCGRLRGYMQGMEATRHRYTIKSGSHVVTLTWEQVDDLLKTRDLIAVPRGSERYFTAREPAE